MWIKGYTHVAALRVPPDALAMLHRMGAGAGPRSVGVAERARRSAAVVRRMLLSA
jgi:hypothetical protein